VPVAFSMNERPSKMTPLSICRLGVVMSPFTRPGAWISIERFALMLPITVPWTDDLADVDLRLDDGALADHSTSSEKTSP